MDCPLKSTDFLKNASFCCFQFQQYQAILFFFSFLKKKREPQIYTNKNHYEEFWGGEATKFRVVRKTGNHAEILTSMNFFSQNTHIAFFLKKEFCVKYNSK